MRYFSLLIIMSFFLFAFSSAVNAQETNACRPIFGGGTSCVQKGNLTLDKKLRSPVENATVDHLDITDPKYSPDQTVVFQITVRNTGSKALKDITVTDIFPQFVTYTKGAGEFDKATNILTYTIKNLAGGQTNTVIIEGKIANSNTLSNVTSPVCVVNQATATQGRNTGSDNTQFCLQSTGTPQTVRQVTTPAEQQPTQTPTKPQPPVLTSPNASVAPKTGPEMIAFIGLLPIGAAGIYLRKKSSK